MEDTVAGNALASIRAGDDIGTSPWITVTQEMIDAFGAATLDPDPMHVDPEWASRHSPFGGTIAFGFLTTSLLTPMMHAAMGGHPHREPRDAGYYLNYGFDRLRLVSPVRAGKRVRGRFHVIDSRRDERQRLVVTFGCTVDIEGEERPALIANWLTVWVPPDT